jgi:GNAT superfamily N-acetyltransferase
VFLVRQTASEADFSGLIALRWRVLRPNRPESSAHFLEDAAADTVHFVAVAENQAVIGCATLVTNNGLQLRGMATAPEWQKQGVGRAVLMAVQSVAAEQKQSLWCNARVSAVGFYESCGWAIEGDEFEVLDVGPHFVMRLSL